MYYNPNQDTKYNFTATLHKLRQFDKRMLHGEISMQKVEHNTNDKFV